MKRYTVICPFCGKSNYSLYLEETGGHMECDKCGKVSLHEISTLAKFGESTVIFPLLKAGVSA